MSNQFVTTSTLVLIISFFEPNKILAEQQSSSREPTISLFYELLAEINTASSPVQLAKLEAFVARHPVFAQSAIWLFEKYVIAKELVRAERFFANLPDSGLSLVNKNWMLAKLYSKRNQNNDALKAFKIAISTTSPSPELLLDFVVFCSRNLKEFEESGFQASLEIDKDELDAMNALWQYVSRDWQTAIHRFNALSQPLQDNMTILYSWGYCLLQLGESESCRQKWERGLETARALSDLDFETKFLLHLGMLAETLETTQAYYDSAYALASKIGHLKWLEFLAGNRGIMYRRQGRFSLADSLFRIAIDAGRQMQSAWRMSVWYPRLGNLLVQQDRFDEALRAYDRGADLARQAGNTERLIRCQIRQGGLYRMLGQYELARRLITGAHEEARDRGEPLLQVQARMELANLDLAIGRYSEAREAYINYLKNPPKTYNELQDHATYGIDAGRTYLKQHNYDAARSELARAFFWADSAKANFDMALALLYLAEIDLITNETEYAHERLDKCVNLATATELYQVLPAMHTLRGDAYQKQHKLVQALRQYQKAAHLIERTRENLTSEASRLDYFGDKADIYDKLVQSYREIYSKTGEAAYKDSLYSYLEIKRGRSLRDIRADTSNVPSDSESNFRFDKLQQAQRRLKIEQRYLRDHQDLLTKQELDSVLTVMQTTRLSFVAQRLRLTQNTAVHSRDLLKQLPSLEKLKIILRDNESSAIFYQLYEHPFALVVTGEETAVIPLQSTATHLDSSIQSLLSPFHRVTDGKTQVIFKAELAHNLHRALVAPIEEKIQLPANILIAPDVHLANLPFELLLTNKPERREYTMTDPPTYSEHFLIQRYSIGYIPNASFLAVTDFSSVPKNVLVFADPFDSGPQADEQRVASLRTGWRFDPLVYSSKEANGIKTVHAKTEVFRRQNATEEILYKEASKYDIIHFATHAFVDTTHDIFSGLVLSTSEDTEDDGILMGYEIANMKLQADLVALSACETGRGKVMQGEGVLGLPRLFLGAGANSVLMTHWKVDDKFAADLMVDFYDHYLKQGLPKARALAEAKRKVLNRIHKSGEITYHHPFYWASFVMFGEPGFLKPSHVNQYIIAASFIFLIALILSNMLRKKRSTSGQKISNKT